VTTFTKSKRNIAAPARAKDSAQAILDVAEALTQTLGYNGFSYADIAARLGVTKASLHYHFASKAELGRALILRYHHSFVAALADIERDASDPTDQLRRYVALYDGVMSNERMCLCGMLAAEFMTLPAPMQEALTEFFDANEHWLAQVLTRGTRGGQFMFREPPRERARLLLGALEGAMLVARAYRDAQRFRCVAVQVLEDLGKSASGQAHTPAMQRRRRG
jgi:TetR/AcrR family transcriptional repressor of nem operon